MKTKVLLVDEDASVHAALSGGLRRKGYDVINAFDTDEAMVCWQTHPGIDLVLLNLCLPVKGDRETFERLTAIDPLVPVIGITWWPDRHPAASAARVSALMTKPVDIPALLETMQRLLPEAIAMRRARFAWQSAITFPAREPLPIGGKPGRAPARYFSADTTTPNQQHPI